MEYFFTFDKYVPDGVGIDRFGAQHICWLLAAAVFCLCSSLVFRRAGTRGRKRLRRGFGAALLVLEAGRVAALSLSGLYGLYYLPLHLCGLAIFLTALHSVRGGAFLGELLFCACMPGAAFALVFPDWLFYPALNYLSITSFCIHILITAYPVMLAAGGELRPSARRLPRCFGLLCAIAGAVYVFDRVFGTNYMFLINPAPDSPLEYFYGLWGKPLYILGYLPMLAAVWLALYLPPATVRRARRKGRSEKPE